MFSQLEKQAVTIRRSISDQRTQKRSQRGKGGRKKNKTKQNFMALSYGCGSRRQFAFYHEILGSS